MSTPIKKGWNSRILYGKLVDFVVTTCFGVIPMISAVNGKSPFSCRSIPTGVDLSRVAADKISSDLFRFELGVAKEDFFSGNSLFYAFLKASMIF